MSPNVLHIFTPLFAIYTLRMRCQKGTFHNFCF